MSNLQELFKKISNTSINVNQNTYVYYDSLGIINKISNRKLNDTEFNILEIPIDDTNDILSGKKRTSDYIVINHPETKTPILTLVSNVLITPDATNNCYNIPKNISNANVTIIKNLKAKCWELKLDAASKLFIESLKDSKNVFYFSVTKKNDPNILYRSIEFKNVSPVPFEYPFEFNNEDVSIYTSKYFNIYSMEIKDDTII